MEKGLMKGALLVGAALSAVIATPIAASAEDKVAARHPTVPINRREVRLHPYLSGRINEMEQELRIMKNRLKALESRKVSSGGNYVSKTKKKVRLRVDGQVNRGILAVAGNGNSEVHHVDGDTSSTRLRFRGDAKAPGGWSIHARIEWEMEMNPSNRTDDSNIKNTRAFAIRKAYVAFKHKTWGRFAFGHEDTATNGIAEIDLSGTTVALKSEVDTIGGGFRFSTNRTGGTGTTVRTVQDNFDGLSRQNVFRYDTPKFYGFWLAVSHTGGDAVSLAVRYVGNLFGMKDFKFAAGIGWDHVPGASETTPGNVAPNGNVGAGNQYSGSFSILHVPTGLSLTGAMGAHVFFGNTTTNPWGMYWKIGWQTKSLLSLGKTAFGFEYFYNKDRGVVGNVFQGFGFGVVQKVKDASLDLYFVYRVYNLDNHRPGTNSGTLHVFMFGTRLKF